MILLYLVHMLCWISFVVLSKQEELCGSLNSRTTYLQLGEHGNIVLQNQTWNNRNVLRCSTELITCPSCSIQISIEHLNLSQICEDTFMLNNKTSSEHCPCGGLAIWEPTTNSPPVHLCSVTEETTFTSSTRSVGISLDFMPVNWTGGFSIHFIAQKNQNVINGKIGHQGYLSSPNFPSLYPRDFGIEHVLFCATNNCVVNLLFTDFLVSPASIMEFYDWDGKPIEMVSGTLARPKLIVSTGPSLVIRFFGNGGTALGYKANYHFVDNTTDIGNISTECGGEVDNLGGTIYMTGLSGRYDCVWIIQPTPAISHFKTHVYLKIIQYAEVSGELTLRQGQTSEDRLLETFINHDVRSIEHVAPVTKGFYLTFKGNLLPESKLIIAYSTFAYMDCLMGRDLLCSNKRCVSITLMCDSFDNCGDNSDEMNCKPEIVPDVEVRYWWPYRGGGMNSDSTPGNALLALGAALTGSAVLLGMTLCRVALRMRSPPSSHAPHHNNMDHIRTIAHLLNIGELDDRDEPPMYEPPPEYSEAVKPEKCRRKPESSTQSLIDGEIPTESGMIEDNEKQILEKKGQLLDIPIPQACDTMNDSIIRLASEPASLETTGYNDDLGLSLTLSMSSQKGINKNPKWFPLPPSSEHLRDPTTPSSNSVLSFDTLYSSEQEFPSLTFSRHLRKSHSQDNVLRIYGESSTSQNTEIGSSTFEYYAFGNQTEKPVQSVKRNSLDDTDLVGNCFMSEATASNSHADNDTTSE